MVDQLHETFMPSSGIVILKLFPLQYEQQKADDNQGMLFEATLISVRPLTLCKIATIIKKLEKYYSLLGFRTLEDTGYQYFFFSISFFLQTKYLILQRYMAMCLVYNLPTIYQVCPHLF